MTASVSTTPAAPSVAPDLRPLACRNPPCPSRRALEPDPEPGWTRCRACGKRWGAGDLFRPYAQVTGGLIIASSVMVSYAWTHDAPAQRWVVLAVAAVQWIVIARRLRYQRSTLAALRRPAARENRGGPV